MWTGQVPVKIKRSIAQCFRQQNYLESMPGKMLDRMVYRLKRREPKALYLERLAESRMR